MASSRETKTIKLGVALNLGFLVAEFIDLKEHVTSEPTQSNLDDRYAWQNILKGRQQILNLRFKQNQQKFRKMCSWNLFDFDLAISRIKNSQRKLEYQEKKTLKDYYLEFDQYFREKNNFVDHGMRIRIRIKFFLFLMFCRLTKIFRFSFINKISYFYGYFATKMEYLAGITHVLTSHI